MANKKYSLYFYQVFENDALKDYLEHMAQKGWRLVKVGSMLLQFESCAPHSIRYCVEIMEKPSAYASNQTLPLKRYREFCQDAGWNYIGTNGLLHVFCTEDPEAIPVETDPQERYERILSACRGTNRTILLMYSFISLLNLFSCWKNGTLLCTQGFVVLILLCAGIYYLGDFQVWKRRAQTALADAGVLPRLSWASVRTKNTLSVTGILLLCLLSLFHTVGAASSAVLPYLLVYLIIYIIMLLFFSRLLYWLREKKAFDRSTNKLIYWGSAVFIIILIMIVCSAALCFFLNNY